MYQSVKNNQSRHLDNVPASGGTSGPPEAKRYRIWFWHEVLETVECVADSEEHAADWFCRSHQRYDTQTAVHVVESIEELAGEPETPALSDHHPEKASTQADFFATLKKKRAEKQSCGDGSVS
jgi:hypothetical protein